MSIYKDYVERLQQRTVRTKFLQIIDMNISECYNINKEIVDVWSRWLIS
jgi:hypothetical protein